MPDLFFLNDNEFPDEPRTATVREDVCDGCAFCVDICPKSCLKIVQNPKRPHARIVRVATRACSGCGVCQGTCPKEAIYIPGLSTHDLRCLVRSALGRNRLEEGSRP